MYYIIFFCVCACARVYNRYPPSPPLKKKYEKVLDRSPDLFKYKYTICLRNLYNLSFVLYRMILSRMGSKGFCIFNKFTQSLYTWNLLILNFPKWVSPPPFPFFRECLKMHFYLRFIKGECLLFNQGVLTFLNTVLPSIS